MEYCCHIWGGYQERWLRWKIQAIVLERGPRRKSDPQTWFAEPAIQTLSAYDPNNAPTLEGFGCKNKTFDKSLKYEKKGYYKVLILHQPLVYISVKRQSLILLVQLV